MGDLLPKSVIDFVIALSRRTKKKEEKKEPATYKEGDDEAASWEIADRYKQREELRENYEYYKRWTERR